MSSILTLAGSLVAIPQGAPAGNPAIPIPLSETVALAKKHFDEVQLLDDSPLSVSLGGLTAAHVVLLRATGGEVRARASSAYGASQAYPVAPLLLLLATGNPITALDLTRVAGSNTTVTVEIFLGEKVQ